MKKVLTKKIILIIFAAAAITTLSTIVNAQTPYAPLAPIPALMNGNTIDLTYYLQNIFNLGIGIAIALSVVYLIIGGFKYITSDALFEKKEAKGTLQNAIFGLILAISTIVILNTVNPRITSVNLSVKPPPATPTPTTPATTPGTTGNTRTCPAYGGGTQSCTCDSCVTPGGIAFKNGVLMNDTLASKLQQAAPGFVVTSGAGQGPIDWRVTEAWPPSSSHHSPCHYDGTCVDLNFYPSFTAGSKPTQSQINDLNTMANALKNAGLNVIYEVSPTDMATLEKAGAQSWILVKAYDTTTAPSFHVTE